MCWRRSRDVRSFVADQVTDWLEEEGVDLSRFEQLADLSFFAVQTRYDDSLVIKSPDWPLLLSVTALLIEEAQRQVS